MAQTQAVWERELWIDDETRAKVQHQVDPLIHDALESTGYIEDRTMSERLALDHYSVLPGPEYRQALSSQTFDFLNTRTQYDVKGRDASMIRGEVNLHQIGGFVNARLATLGSRYFYGMAPNKGPNGTMPQNRINESAFRSILEDVRAHTELGYSQSEEPASAIDTIGEIEHLGSSLSIDRRSHLQLLTDPDHGDIKIEVGESLVDRLVVPKGSRKRRRRVTGRMFEVAAQQPIEDGSIITKLQYRSTRRKTDMKLTVAIDGEYYSDEQKEALYEEEVRRFQDPRYARFADAIVKNLVLITAENTDAIRVG